MRKYLGSGRYQGAGEPLSETLASRLANPPQLQQLRYRPGDYHEFRQALFDQVTLDPRLLKWSYRGSDDPAVALLETAATIGEILALYGEVYASEAFLGSARWSNSIQDLIRLSGYRLSPGLGGLADIAFVLKGRNAVTVPAGFGIQVPLSGGDMPAYFETNEAKKLFPGFSNFQLYRPVDFSQGTHPSQQRFFFDAANGQAPPQKLAPGDRLMMGVLGDNDRLEGGRIAVIEAVDQVLGLTAITLKGGGLPLGAKDTHVMVYKVKDTYRHFGHNAPSSGVGLKGAALLYANWRKTNAVTSGSGPLSNPTKATILMPFINPILNPQDYPLDREVNDLVAGETFAIEAPLHDYLLKPNPKVIAGSEDFTLEALQSKAKANILVAAKVNVIGIPITVTAEEYYGHQIPSNSVTHIRTLSVVRSIMMSWGAVNGPSTLVQLDKALGASDEENENVTTALIGGIRLHRIVGTGMVFRPWLQPSGESGNELTFLGTEEEADALVGRRLLVSAEGRPDSILTVTGKDPWSLYSVNGPTLRRIFVDRTVEYKDFPLENGALFVNGNLVSTSQGKSEAETVLGDGDPNLAFQGLRIPRKPLTYLLDPQASPPEVPQLQVFVSGKLWQRVNSFYGQAAEAPIYIVREDEEGFSWIQFGDGQTGLRPERGTGNIRASFRHGAGAFGPIEERQSPNPVGQLDNLKSLRLVGIVSGGSQRESSENARMAAPGKVLGLGRIVSLADVAHELSTISGVVKVCAAWQIHEGSTALVATVLMEIGREAELESVRHTIHEFNRSHGSARFPILVLPGTLCLVEIKLRYGLEIGYRRDSVAAEIHHRLGSSSEEELARTGLFALRSREFGQWEYARTIEALVAVVAGVTWAEVTKLHRVAKMSVGAIKPCWGAFLLHSAPALKSSSKSRAISCPQNSILILDQANLILEPSSGDAP